MTKLSILPADDSRFFGAIESQFLQKLQLKPSRPTIAIQPWRLCATKDRTWSIFPFRCRLPEALLLSEDQKRSRIAYHPCGYRLLSGLP